MKMKYKYRAKRHSGEWVYGSLVWTEHIEPAIYYEVGRGKYYTIHYCYVNPDTVGQFTGLLDKNGKKIYEGDIIRHPYVDPIFGDFVESKDGDGVTSEVVFHDGAFVVKFDVNDYIYLDGFTRNGHVEVIGNIHDNPELLEK